VIAEAPWLAVLANAERLLADAKVLRKARRYASAVALTVLGLEEAGKVITHAELFETSAPLSPRARGYHKAKQRVVGRALLATMGIYEVVKMIKMIKPIDQLSWIDADPLAEIIRTLSDMTDAQYDHMAGDRLAKSPDGH
jgi:AbiV family abortive infection protein